MDATEQAGATSSDARRGWLDEHRRDVQRERAQAFSVETRWSWARLAAFGLAVTVWYPLLFNGYLALAALLGGVGLFVLTVRRHQRVRRRREALDRLLLVIEETSQRSGGRVALVRSFERPADADDPEATPAPILESGATWPLTDQERDDLDVYAAPVGLFGLLNRTSTIFGARRLQAWIDNTCLDPKHIRARQEAVRWLDEHPAERLRLQAGAAALRREDEYLAALARAVRGAKPLPLPFPAGLLRGWSAASLIFTVVAVGLGAIGNTGWLWALLGLLAFNGSIYARLRRGLGDCLATWRNVWRAADGCAILARQATEDLPSDTDLGRLRECFAAVAPDDVLPSLRRRVGWSESGGPFHTLLNMLLFYDLHVASAILHRALPHREELLQGLSAIGDLEALTSLGSFAWEQPVVCYPVLTEERGLSIIGGRHPLIPPERVVANDVGLSARTHVWIVTGSNMSGKSTLLRMVGTCVVLGQIGCAVPAERMTWKPVRLITDLCARDSLANQESYFLAEVRHLRRMVLPPAGEAPVLGLIDEPFRGTNSYEQVAASVGVVRHLVGLPHLYLIATHERRLTTLADGSSAQNYHFRENLDANGLVFDYRLRAGPARTRNALRILEMEGYPQMVLDWARQCVEEGAEPGPSNDDPSE
ncbi:MAG: hypothetical protein IH986_08785 [Planctomycetes bacterium]|nr:hypothetical protein [Planctomycetota bacterium]